MAAIFVSSHFQGFRPIVPPSWRDRFGWNPVKRAIGSFGGFFIVMFGARMADRCASGHLLSGGVQMAVSAWRFIGMKKDEKRLLAVVVCCAAATCAVAGLVTHNRTSAPLTLAEVLITAIIPLVLLGYVTVYYASNRLSGDDVNGKDRMSRWENRSKDAMQVQQGGIALQRTAFGMPKPQDGLLSRW